MTAPAPIADRSTGAPATRALPLSPTLARLATRPRGGFTLVEILISLVISLVIILTAVSAFRLASHAIGLANEMSIENGMLRTGFQATLEDVDFYHSEADDKFPYKKGYTRNRTLKADDPTTPQNDMFERGHFQPLRFLASTDPDVLPFDSVDPTDPTYTEAWTNVVNPNVLQAHDPRSIDRSFILANVTPNPGFNSLNYRFGKPAWVHGDYRLVACTDMRYQDVAVPMAPAKVESRTPAIVNQPFPYGTSAKRANWPRDFDAAITYTPPTGPNPPKTEVTADLMADAFNEGGLLCPVRTSYNCVIPLLGWQVFNRTSFIGMTEYLPPGCNLYIMDQGGGWPNDAWRSYNGKAPSFTSPKGFAQPSTTRTYLPSVWWRAYGSGCRDIASFLGTDFRENWTWAVVSRPTQAAPPGTGSFGIYETSPTMVQLMPTALVLGMGTNTWWFGEAGQEDVGDVARDDRAYTSTTVRLPYNQTDVERSVLDGAAWQNQGNGGAFAWPHYQNVAVDYTSKPSRYPILATTMLRYHRLGGTTAVAVSTITVEDQASGRRVTMVCVPYGTTYRGARQHWRLYSAPYAQKNAIGDFYDDAAGPFYAP
jgi:hypothetical protein